MSTTLPSIDLVVVMPLGPNDDPLDTLQSVLTYATTSRAIIVVDDTHKPETPSLIHELDKDIVVIPAGNYPGGWGGLWVKLTQGYRYALEHYDFKILLRLDADALIIAPGTEREAIAYFDRHPAVGLLGSYKIDCNGEPRIFDHPAKTLRFEASILGLRHPRVRSTLRSALAAAKQHGYEDGEHCLGGAYIHSRSCIDAMDERGWLNHPELNDSNLGEDQLFALFTVASGFEIGDFATGNLPLGIRWRGLPCSPQELLDRGKKITHSVRFWQDMDEQAIRGFFAAKRQYTTKTSKN